MRFIMWHVFSLSDDEEHHIVLISKPIQKQIITLINQSPLCIMILTRSFSTIYFFVVRKNELLCTQMTLQVDWHLAFANKGAFSPYWKMCPVHWNTKLYKNNETVWQRRKRWCECSVHTFCLLALVLTQVLGVVIFSAQIYGMNRGQNWNWGIRFLPLKFGHW